MCRLLLLVLLCGLSAYAGFPQRLYTRVEVTVNDETYLDTLEVEDLFKAYAKTHGFSSNDVHVHRVKDCGTLTHSRRYHTSPAARFEAHVTDCIDFLTYLLQSGRKLSDKYGWDMIHVNCDRLHSSLCLVNPCSPQDHIDIGRCAYNTTP